MRRMDEFRKLLRKKSIVGEVWGNGSDIVRSNGMWSAVTPDDVNGPAPSARSKHSATLLAGNIYLLGGRNGNVPLKDLWKYNLAEGRWYQLQPNGDRPPCLQEHTAVAYRDSIYVFGGEVGFSAGTETPLWVYDVQRNTWKKLRSKKGVVVPRGRRGHTALVHRGTMLIYGGYQDLRGSCAELWAFHFETESWHLISNTTGSDYLTPPPRHKHSAIIHAESMWVYGGMTDLNERSDLWRWDTVSRTWTAYNKLKHGPGSLHSHAACRLPGSMLLFGGESGGHPVNDIWKFNFDTEIWEKIQINGVKPQPRAECVALTISELLLTDGSAGTTLESRMARTRSRTSNSAGADKRPLSYIPNNRVSPYEKTYVFKPSQENYTDGSHEQHQQTEQTDRTGQTSFLREISKLSQINLSRLGNNKCSYTVLTTGNNDSTESLLRQHSVIPDTDSESATPTRMIKSKSAYAIKKKYNLEPQAEMQETNIDSTTLQNTRLNSEIGKMTREPISVPNFSTITLPTPVLTPVEAARLVFLDSEDENDDNNTTESINKVIQVQASSSPKKCVIYENFKPVKRGESYSSHLGYADNPLYQHMVSSPSVKFEKCPEVVEILSDENISTSDYASIETMNRLSSSSSYSTTSRQNTPQDETKSSTTFKVKTTTIQSQIQDGPFGFCNPNYMGPDIQVLLSSGNKVGWKPSEADSKKQYCKLLNTPDSGLEDNVVKTTTNRYIYCEENLELQNMVNSEMSKECSKHGARHNLKKTQQPRSFELDSLSTNSKPRSNSKCRASSASRIERHNVKRTNIIEKDEEIRRHPTPDVFVPLYVFIIGGKEHGQVTVFKRPVSIWKLKLF